MMDYKPRKLCTTPEERWRQKNVTEERSKIHVRTGMHTINITKLPTQKYTPNHSLQETLNKPNHSKSTVSTVTMHVAFDSFMTMVHLVFHQH